MQNDWITWEIIKNTFCSFKLKSHTQMFCRNEYNVTGICSRSACPLANSQYATVREEKGICYLYIRTAERAFFPAKQWEKIKLSRDFRKALQQIDENLLFWRKYYIERCKHRLLKIIQYLGRMRKIKLNEHKKLVPVRTKRERLVKKREQKALIAAKLDFAIEDQLVKRLKKGTYERIYNYPKEILEEREKEGEPDGRIQEYDLEDNDVDMMTEEDAELQKEMDRDLDEEEEEEELEREFVADFEESETEDLDMEEAVKYLVYDQEDTDSETEPSRIWIDPETVSKKKRRRKKKARVEIEYEEEEPKRVPITL